jgi:type I restriction enzyme S subunit
VDELMALCDRLEAQQHERETRHAALARASLARFADAPTPANLNFIFHKSYAIPPADLRKSILTLAVQGKLVPQDPNDELSDSIPEIIPSSPPLDVPDSWRWTEFGEIGEISGGFAFKSGDYTPSGVFILRVTNIAPSGVISKDEAVFLPPEKVTREVERFYLNEGDILLVMVGGSLGKIGLVTSDILPALLNQNLWRITPVNGEVDSQFLRLITDFAVSFQRQITHSTHGHLSREEFRKKPVALPPRAEQRRIVAKVEQLMALVDALETQLAASRASAANLLSALVAELTGTANLRNASVPTARPSFPLTASD